MVEKMLLSTFGKRRINPIKIVTALMVKSGIEINKNYDFYSKVDSIINGSVSLSNNYYLHKTRMEEKLDIRKADDPYFYGSVISFGSRSVIKVSYGAEYQTEAEAYIEDLKIKRLCIFGHLIRDESPLEDIMQADISPEIIGDIPYFVLLNRQKLDELLEVYGKKTKQKKKR